MHVVVIGCGLAGVTTAYYLHRLGAEVTVVDREPGPARGASHANGSLLTPSLADPWNSPGVFRRLIGSIGREDSAMLLRPSELPKLSRWGVSFLRNSKWRYFSESYLHNVHLSLYSRHLLHQLMDELAIDFEHSSTGVLKIFQVESELAKSVKVAHWLKQAGITHRVLDPDSLVSLEPALEPVKEILAGALKFDCDEVGNAYLFCVKLKEHLAESGVRFRFSEQVRSLRITRNRIQAVATAREDLVADSFVLAAGCYSPGLVGNMRCSIPVAPAKGYSLTLRSGGRDASPVLPRHAIVDDSLHAVVSPLGPDKLRIAGTAEFAGFDTQVRSERIENLLNLFKRIFPEIPIDQSRIQSWAGLRPMTPDGRPILGPTPYENFFLNTGHGALGWTMACASGKTVAEIVVGEPPDYDVSPFVLDRF